LHVTSGEASGGNTGSILERRNQSLGRTLSPCRFERSHNRSRTCLAKRDIRTARCAPFACDRREDLRVISYDQILILWRQHHSSEAIVRMAERGEDATGDPEICVPHVRALDSVGEAQRQPTKLCCFHLVLP
jgi:hypothetical protein